jgi:hypothetical protein
MTMSLNNERSEAATASQAKRWGLALIACCLLAIASAVLWHFGGMNASTASHEAEPTTPRSAGNVTLANANPLTSGPAIHPLPNITKEFGVSQNLASFVADHVDAATKGDGSAARLIANAYEECKQLSANPQSYGQGLKSVLGKSITAERSAAFDAAIEREQRRCSGLISSSSPGGKEVSLWVHGAAENGDLAAQVRLARSSQDANSLVEFQSKLIASSDGPAMSEFGASLSDLSPDERQKIGGISAERLSNYAWAMAACEFGEDCSAAGEPLRTLCLRAALCGPNRLEDAYHQLLSPIDFEDAWRLRNQIVEAVQRGNAAALTNATH